MSLDTDNAESIYRFLKDFPPFDLVNPEELERLSSKVTLKRFAKDERIVEKGEKVFPYFFVVKSGSINIYDTVDDKQSLIDVCDEGDVVGVRAALANDTYIANASANENTALYFVPFEDFNNILKTHPKIALYLASGFASGLSVIKQPEEQTQNLKNFLSRADEDNTEIDTIKLHSKKKIINCTPDHTVREAAKFMVIFNVGSILVTDKDEIPLGIITDTDFRKKVVSQDESVKDKPVSTIMSSPVKTIKPDLSVAEAMLHMINQQVSHFCITEDGTNSSKAIGVVSQRDVLIAQGNNPAALAKQLRRTTDVSKIVEIRNNAEKLVKSYLKKDIGIAFIANIITEINDVLINKAAEIAKKELEEEGLGKIPAEFAWVSLGSEGRKEQLLRTDQDNALIYADTDKAEAKKTRTYFLKFGKKISRILSRSGFEDCPADLMASNPKWCQPLSKWKKYFTAWINEPTPEAILNTTVFFDFRPVVGSQDLADQLKAYIFEEVGKNTTFLSYLAKNALENPPPLSFFKSFIVEKSGSHKNEFDIKARAMMPLIDAARVLTYQHKIKGYHSTMERFEAIAKQDKNIASLCEAAAMGYGILLKQRASFGLKNKNSGRFINPKEINKLEKQTIRNIFKTIEKIQQVLETRFRLGFLR